MNKERMIKMHYGVFGLLFFPKFTQERISVLEKVKNLATKELKFL